jgi:hypothetical protein
MPISIRYLVQYTSDLVFQFAQLFTVSCQILLNETWYVNANNITWWDYILWLLVICDEGKSVSWCKLLTADLLTGLFRLFSTNLNQEDDARKESSTNTRCLEAFWHRRSFQEDDPVYWTRKWDKDWQPKINKKILTADDILHINEWFNDSICTISIMGKRQSTSDVLVLRGCLSAVITNSGISSPACHLTEKSTLTIADPILEGKRSDWIPWSNPVFLDKLSIAKILHCGLNLQFIYLPGGISRTLKQGLRLQTKSIIPILFFIHKPSFWASQIESPPWWLTSGAQFQHLV